MKLSRNRILFYSGWFLILLLQASFIELMSDEAYYWRYSQDLDWGYLDHPPMIAFLIKIGYSVFGGEFGVRLLPIILGVASIYIWERIVKPKNLWFFYAMVMSIGILHFLSFMAIPDSPLLFFGSLFVLFYKKITESRNKLLNYILAGVAAGLMLLSKYHGVLLIFFVILSNFRLLLNLKFWLGVGVAGLVFLPHAFWQISHDYLSLQFHLKERSFEPYDVADTLEYIGTQLFVLGPVTGILCFIAIWKQKAEDKFESFLKILFWGVLLFFLFMSFKGNVEAHWTFITIIPALYFGYRYYESRGKAVRWIKGIAIAVFSLAFLSKAALMIDLSKWYDMPLFYAEWQSNEARSLAIEEKAGDRPVAFMNSYQKASLYEFYTGHPSFSISNAVGRKDQFGVWKVEDQFAGKEVVIVANYYAFDYDSIMFKGEDIRYKFAPNFRYYNELEAIPQLSRSTFESGESISFSALVKDHGDTQIHSNYPLTLHYHIFEGEQLIATDHFADVSQDQINHKVSGSITFPEKEGEYRLQINIKTGWLPPAISQNYFEFKIQ